jgi:hypothetical protein
MQKTIKNEIFLILIFFIFSFYHILFGGIVSDYNTIFALEGIAYNKEINSLTKYIFIYFNEQLFDRKIIRLAYLSSGIIGSFNPLVIKIIHFLIYLILSYRVYNLGKIIINKNFSLIFVLLFVINIEYSLYLDPLGAWPFYGISFIIIIEHFILLVKFIKNQKFNKLYFITIYFLLIFYLELGLLFSLNIFFIIIYKLIHNKIKKREFGFYLSFVLACVFAYLLLKIIINLSNSSDIYSGTKLKIYYPESIISYIYQLVRSFPLTSLLMTDNFYHFKLFLTKNIYYYILILGFLYYFSFKNYLKKKIFLEKQNNILLLIIAFQFLLLPPLLMALNERYALQLSGHGLGHAHYIVFLQKIGASMIIASIIFFIIKKTYNSKLISLVSILFTIIFYLNGVQNHMKTKKHYVPENDLYPYVYFENLSKKFLQDKKIDIVVLEDTKFKSWWDSDINFSRFLKQKTDVYGHWMHNNKKPPELNNKNLDQFGVIFFKNLKFNNKLFYGEFCYFAPKAKKNYKDIINCKDIFTYQEKRWGGYLNFKSTLKINHSK